MNSRDELSHSDRELAWKYLPHFHADEAEPFAIQAVGYTVFWQDGQSASSRRVFRLDRSCCCMIEYAVYFDFDIQHLYDLEHVFVYIGHTGEIVDVEASFHGKFLRSMINGVLRLEEDTHPVIYMQPGKHAMMPEPDYFHLYIELYTACRERAGSDGFLVAPMFEERLHTSPERDQRVCSYIRQNYSFTPKECYRYCPLSEKQLMPYRELEELIVERMQYWLDIIEADGV